MVMSLELFAFESDGRIVLTKHYFHVNGCSLSSNKRMVFWDLCIHLNIYSHCDGFPMVFMFL